MIYIMTKGRKQFNRICSTKVKYTHKEIDALAVNQDLFKQKMSKHETKLI